MYDKAASFDTIAADNSDKCVFKLIKTVRNRSLKYRKSPIGICQKRPIYNLAFVTY